MVKWLYSYRDDYLAKGLFNHGRRVQKVHFRLTCVFLRSFLSCHFTGKLVVAWQIRLFSQTQSVQEKNTACITLIKLFRSYKVMGTLQSYDDGDGAKIKQLLCMHLHKLFCQFL